MALIPDATDDMMYGISLSWPPVVVTRLMAIDAINNITPANADMNMVLSICFLCSMVISFLIEDTKIPCPTTLGKR